MARRGGEALQAIDAYVGGRMRRRRLVLGMTQQKLADSLGLTHQQVQKYESGANRIGASRLHELSCVLDVPVAYFFENYDFTRSAGAAGAGNGAQPTAGAPVDRSMERETLELVRSYSQIADDELRRRLYELIKSIGRAGES